jgi:hypothetical protein
MRRFAQTRSDREREALMDALHGGGAFRRFKDTVRRFGADADWYAFRGAALEQITREWLEANRLAFEA